MKLEQQDMVYFTPAFPRPNLTMDFEKRPRLLVTEWRTARSHQKIGQIVKVKGTYFERGRYWYITEGGDYAYGHLAGNPDLGYSYVVVPLGPSLWGHGSITETRENSPNKVSINFVSDPHGAGKFIGMLQGFTISTDLYFQGMSNYDNMPHQGWNDRYINAAFEMQKERWTQDWKKASILVEGMQRRWLEHLTKIRENHAMPYPRMNVEWTGQILIPSTEASVPRDSLNDRDKRLISRLEKTGKAKLGERAVSYKAINASYLLNNEANTQDDLNRITTGEYITQSVRGIVDNYDISTTTTETRVIMTGTVH